MINPLFQEGVTNSIIIEKVENNIVGGVIDVTVKTQTMTQFQAVRKYSEVLNDDIPD